MGTWCATTSCGKAYIEWKTVKAMNAKGIYTPSQITDTVQGHWDSVAGGNSTISLEQCKKVTENSINDLGSIGDGQKFDEAQYESQKKFVGIILNLVKKEQIDALVTKLTAKTDFETKS